VIIMCVSTSRTIDEGLVLWCGPDTPLLEADKVQGCWVEIGSGLIYKDIDVHRWVDERQRRESPIRSLSESCVLASI